MAQYFITASSNKLEQTINNTTFESEVDTDGDGVSEKVNVTPFPSPAEYETLEKAQKAAEAYAASLNDVYYNGAYDWVGNATLND